MMFNPQVWRLEASAHKTESCEGSLLLNRKSNLLHRDFTKFISMIIMAFFHRISFGIDAWTYIMYPQPQTSDDK